MYETILKIRKMRRIIWYLHDTELSRRKVGATADNYFVSNQTYIIM